CWSIKDSSPTPHFLLGTPGYMSVQQENPTHTPSKYDDIYALGALLFYIISNIHPVMIDRGDSERIFDLCNFLTCDKSISALITSCFNEEQSKRPSLKELKNTIGGYNIKPSK